MLGLFCASGIFWSAYHHHLYFLLILFFHPQKRFGHPFVKSTECPWRGIVVRVIYMFTKLDIKCPFLPEDVDVQKTEAFREWLCKDPKEYEYPFHNGLKLFLWLINDCYHLEDDVETV